MNIDPMRVLKLKHVAENIRAARASMNIDPMRVLKPNPGYCRSGKGRRFNEHRPDEGTETSDTAATARDHAPASMNIDPMRVLKLVPDIGPPAPAGGLQ